MQSSEAGGGAPRERLINLESLEAEDENAVAMGFYDDSAEVEPHDHAGAGGRLQKVEAHGFQHVCEIAALRAHDFNIPYSQGPFYLSTLSAMLWSHVFWIGCLTN